MFLWDSDRPRHRRGHRYYPGYSPYQFYNSYSTSDREYEDVRYDHISFTRRRRRTLDCNNDTCLHCRDYREPYEFLRHYDPLADLMEEVHDYFNAMETGRFIAQDAADKFEELSRAVNRISGYDPVLKPYSGFLKQLARETQLLPDNALIPRMLRPRRRWQW